MHVQRINIIELPLVVNSLIRQFTCRVTKSSKLPINKILGRSIRISGLAALVGLSCSLCPANYDNSSPKPLSVSERAEQEREPSKQREEDCSQANYSLVKKYAIDNFLLRYVENVAPRSSSFKDNILKRKGNNFGEKAKAFTEDYSQGHVLLLDAVCNEKIHDGEISDKDIKDLSLELAEKMARDGGSIKYSDPKVLKQLENWARTRMNFFEKLVKSSSNGKEGEEGFRNLINGAFTRQELEDYIYRQSQANNGLYDSMQNTVRGIKYLLSDLEFTPIREETAKVYNSLRDWIKEK